MTLPSTLSGWQRAIEHLLRDGHDDEAIALAAVVLHRLPRHLPTYTLVLRALCRLKRWGEADEWARRLLRADPGCAIAWRSLALSAEAADARPRAQRFWRRAFEIEPYHPGVRAGLSRTSLPTADEGGTPAALRLNAVAIAALYLRGGHWGHAAAAYHALVAGNEGRVDLQVGWMLALWQQGEVQDAHAVAQRLTRANRHLLPAWTVLAATGHADDRALAHSPLSAMDPSGCYIAARLNRPAPVAPPVPLSIDPDEAALLQSRVSGDLLLKTGD